MKGSLEKAAELLRPRARCGRWIGGLFLGSWSLCLSGHDLGTSSGQEPKLREKSAEEECVRRQAARGYLLSTTSCLTSWELRKGNKEKRV